MRFVIQQNTIGQRVSLLHLGGDCGNVHYSVILRSKINHKVKIAEELVRRRRVHVCLQVGERAN